MILTRMQLRIVAAAALFAVFVYSWAQAASGPVTADVSPEWSGLAAFFAVAFVGEVALIFQAVDRGED